MINQGNTVTWTNKDSEIQTVTEDQPLLSSKDMRPAQTFDYTIDSAGRFVYHCMSHLSMTGKIIVN